MPVAQGVDGGTPFVKLGVAGVGSRRQRGEDLRGEDGVEVRVHAGGGIAYAHRASGVPVVSAPQGEETPAGPAQCPLVLDGEFEGDLDRDRAGVGEEDMIEPGWSDSDESFGESDGRGMRESAEHDVGERLELPCDRLVDVRVTIAVDDRPPRAHRVEGGETASFAVDEVDPRPGGPGDGEVRSVGECSVGVPEQSAFPLMKRRGVSGSLVPPGLCLTDRKSVV